MILQTADGTKYQVSFRHFVPCRPTRIKGKGVCRGEARWPVGLPGLHGGSDRRVYTKDEGEIRGFHQLFARGPKTIVIIQRLTSNGTLVGVTSTEARLKPGDTFTKKMGRRIALGRALTEMTVMDLITEAQREQLMIDYAWKVAPR